MTTTIINKEQSTINLAQGGIYSITNTVNKRVYIGRSQDIEARWMQHRISLANKSHHNKELQGDYNKFGINNFKFDVVEFTDKINELELKYIFEYADKGIDVYNDLTTKDRLKSELIGRFAKFGVMVKVDHHPKGLVSVAGRDLSYALKVDYYDATAYIELNAYHKDFKLEGNNLKNNKLKLDWAKDNLMIKVFELNYSKNDDIAKIIDYADMLEEKIIRFFDEVEGW